MGLGLLDLDVDNLELRVIADLTLALFLFIDAANANLKTLKRKAGIPARMLLIGLPGAIALGSGLALVMFGVAAFLSLSVLGAASRWTSFGAGRLE